MTKDKKKGGRPKKKYSLKEEKTLKILKALYLFGPLSITELKKLLYPNNPTGTGLPSIDKRIEWLESPLPPLSEGHKKFLKEQRGKQFVKKARKSREKIAYVELKKHKRRGIKKVESDYNNHNHGFQELELTKYKSYGFRKRYHPKPEWIEEAARCGEEAAKLMHKYLLNAPSFVFRDGKNIIQILRDLMLNFLALRIEKEGENRWKGYLDIPPDRELLKFLRNKVTRSFIEGSHATVYPNIITTEAMGLLLEDK